MSSYSDPTPSEKGYPAADPKAPGALPAGGAKWVTPPHLQYQWFLNTVSRTWTWTHDEALRDSACNAEAMWRDPVITSAIRARQLSVVQLERQLEPRNPTDPAEKKLTETLNQVLDEIPNFQQFRRCLLDAFWPGRAAVQCSFRWDYSAGEKRMLVHKWTPIHGDTLVFKFDGTVGYLVNPTQMGSPGVERIEGRGGVAKFLTPEEDECVFVHEFEPEPAGFFQPELAGSVRGSGFRGRVYWYWWLKQQLLKTVFDFARKAGNGFFLAGYEPGNRTELAALQEAMESQAGQPVLYVPMAAGRQFSEVLQHLPVEMSGAQFQLGLIEYVDGIIRDTILGETQANHPGASGGIGSGQAEQRGMADDERVKYDAKDLETPMQKLVNVLARYISPGVRPPLYRHLTDKRNPEEVIMCAKEFAGMGGTIPKPWMQEQLGIPEPQKDEEVLSLVQAQQATALGAVPAGVPLQGQPGPVPAGADAGQQPEGGQPVAQPDPQQAGLEQQIQPMATV